jgi:hypothetical protein
VDAARPPARGFIEERFGKLMRFQAFPRKFDLTGVSQALGVCKELREVCLREGSAQPGSSPLCCGQGVGIERFLQIHFLVGRAFPWSLYAPLLT